MICLKKNPCGCLIFQYYTHLVGSQGHRIQRKRPPNVGASKHERSVGALRTRATWMHLVVVIDAIKNVIDKGEHRAPKRLRKSVEVTTSPQHARREEGCAHTPFRKREAFEARPSLPARHREDSDHHPSATKIEE